MKYFILFLKGVAMGAANVIPGVSGGTIAFITGIYDRLIKALKSFDFKAVKLLFTGKLKDFAAHVDLQFLVILFVGVAISLVSIGKLLSYLFDKEPLLVWAFFFGLIVASIFYVGKMVRKWSVVPVITLLIGAGIAVGLAFLKPAAEDAGFPYLVICGVVAIASMVLPGLSGSYVLILLGNYQLIMLTAVPALDFNILLPVALGAGIGFLVLSHLIHFLLEKFHDGTVAMLTGFVIGSLIIIWPWKTASYLTDASGTMILKKGKPVVESYNWNAPDFSQNESLYAIGLIVVGAMSVILIEKIGTRLSPKEVWKKSSTEE